MRQATRKLTRRKVESVVRFMFSYFVLRLGYAPLELASLFWVEKMR